ncbi:MAG: hypothetical protein WC340_14105 [Kiritimatiellia bacterium]
MIFVWLFRLRPASGTTPDKHRQPYSFNQDDALRAASVDDSGDDVGGRLKPHAIENRQPASSPLSSTGGIAALDKVRDKVRDED